MFSLITFATILAFVVAADLPHSARQSKFPKFTEESCLSLPTLVCHVQPTDSYNARGVVYFSPTWQPRTPGSSLFTCYTRIRAAVGGLTSPYHGFHVHTYGDLSSPVDGTSTGGHFSNPAGEEIMHALPPNSTRHWGDLGNLQPGEDNVAQYDRINTIMRLGGVVGRAITIHEGQDMGVDAQPSGASGPRVGFCVIGYANPDIVPSMQI